MEADLLLVRTLLSDNPRLGAVLRAPTISPDRKNALLRSVLEGQVTDLSLRFLDLVVTKRREEILAAAYEEFHRLANEARGVLPVHVTSAVPLSAAQQEALAAALGRKTGKQLILATDTDPALVGGLVVRLGDLVIDGSIRTKLAQLRQHLAGHVN